MKRIVYVLGCAIMLFTLGFAHCANAQIITTIAGNGTPGLAGDGTPAIGAELYNPDGIYLDTSGNIFVADQANNCIRKINAAGIISTIAGNGTPGYSGDGGQATAALLNAPISVILDHSGNIFFAEYGNHVIRKINPLGVISTIAGTGLPGFMGDGGQATAARFNGPEGLSLDAVGNMYIADAHNQCIRKINTLGVISTIAGTGSAGYNGDGIAATTAQLNNPFGIFADGEGNIFIADQSNNRIRKVSTLGIISTIAGTGGAGFAGDTNPATAALLNDPVDVFLDGAHNGYIPDKLNGCIRKVDAGGIITTIAGTGTSGYSGDGGAPTLAELNWPTFVFVDTASKIYFTDYQNNRIREITECIVSITHQPSPDTVLVGSNAIFTVTTPISFPAYQWQEDPGTGFVNLSNVWPYSGVFTDSLTIHSASALLNSTHYRCVVTNGSACVDTSSSAILLVHSAAATHQLNADEFRIFPNPAHDNIIVNVPTSPVEGDIELISELGDILIRQKITGYNTTINLNGLSVGMYIIKIRCDNQVICRNVFKN